MRYERLHAWDLSPTEAVALQKELRGRLKEVKLDPDSVRLIAGMDVSCTRFDPMLTAGIVLWDRLTGRVVETAFVREPGRFPYIPGLLSFREIPVLLKAWEQLSARPDVVMVDGQGIAHPRRLGIAAHVGLLIDVPTIGVGKSKLTGTHDPVGPHAGDRVPLTDGTEVSGAVLRTKMKSNPLFVSVGNRIDLASAVGLVQDSLRGYRLPEPTRLAHTHVNLARTTGHGLPVEGPAPF